MAEPELADESCPCVGLRSPFARPPDLASVFFSNWSCLVAAKRYLVCPRTPGIGLYRPPRRPPRDRGRFLFAMRHSRMFRLVRLRLLFRPLQFGKHIGIGVANGIRVHIRGNSRRRGGAVVPILKGMCAQRQRTVRWRAMGSKAVDPERCEGDRQYQHASTQPAEAISPRSPRVRTKRWTSPKWLVVELSLIHI